MNASWAESALAASLLATALVHLMPASGLLSDAQLHRLYGIAVADDGTRLLLRHRALLFGLVGGALLAAALQPGWRVAGALAGLVAMLGFIVLAQGLQLPPPLQRVLRIDQWLSAVLALALGWRLLA